MHLRFSTKNLLTEMLENFDINSGEKISRYKSNKKGQIKYIFYVKFYNYLLKS